MEDLKQLIEGSKNSNYINNLIRSGLAETSSTEVILEGYGVAKISVHISELGKLLVALRTIIIKNIYIMVGYLK
ncbi:hypothetical protein ACF3DV_00380 [Chlorogloeopsis fritschii PCC 9212]|uniref:Uncharacterized protein n=1 Tax=Chlorogloeopsis fritschii PCC 6912 TaxID=211165 RepID=A0A3S0Y1F8_CHLFR|nr:hypothetical protein [Chlorogloeopsis fritschii]RUR86030.1 hypothetical protein PCC6912_08550 [Chlorogloeopsis fritschii PCC 6912]